MFINDHCLKPIVTNASQLQKMSMNDSVNQRSPELDTCIPQGTLHNMLIQPAGANEIKPIRGACIRACYVKVKGKGFFGIKLFHTSSKTFSLLKKRVCLFCIFNSGKQ